MNIPVTRSRLPSSSLAGPELLAALFFQRKLRNGDLLRERSFLRVSFSLDRGALHTLTPHVKQRKTQQNTEHGIYY